MTRRNKHIDRICTECRAEWGLNTGVCPACGSHQWSRFVPTREEIAASCAAIQRTWTPAQRYEHESLHAQRVAFETATPICYHNHRIVRMEMRPT